MREGGRHGKKDIGREREREREREHLHGTDTYKSKSVRFCKNYNLLMKLNYLQQIHLTLTVFMLYCVVASAHELLSQPNDAAMEVVGLPNNMKPFTYLIMRDWRPEMHPGFVRA